MTNCLVKGKEELLHLNDKTEYSFFFNRQKVDRMLVRDTSGELTGLSRINVNLLKCSVLSCLF